MVALLRNQLLSAGLTRFLQNKSQMQRLILPNHDVPVEVNRGLQELNQHKRWLLIGCSADGGEG